MLLRPVHLDISLIGQYLPWDLYTASGVLVTRAGIRVANAKQFAELSGQALFRRAFDANDAHLAQDNPGARLQRLAASLENDLRDAGTSTLEAAVRGHAQSLLQLARKDRDALLGLARLMPVDDPALRHCLLVAVIASDLGQHVGFAGRELESLVCAALTMNIAAMRLHADLAKGMERYNEFAEADIRRHPERGAHLLEIGGIVDADWLETVRQHHENLDGSGYPGGLMGEEIVPAARLLRVIDFYVAKLSGRRDRRPKTAQIALRQLLLGTERQRLDASFAVPLLRRYGLYPAGTLVRLANKEIAVVVRQAGKGPNASIAMSFMRQRERRFAFPIERDTSQAPYGVVEVLEVEAHWREMPWEGFWGY